MSYPFTTFPLVNRVGVTNPYANIDARYGPWLSLTDALTSYNAGLRFRGLTVGIYEPNFNTNGSIVEYWFKDGVADNNLVLKTAGGTGGGANGATGASGYNGSTGATGFIGGTGATGFIGSTGATGFIGGTGATGFIGGTGATGVQGLPGDKYSTSSVTSHSITTGAKTFAVGTGLAYSIGQTVIIANDTANFMKAIVTNYTGNQLSVNVTVLNGTGTFSLWQINLEGAPGAQGPTGATGPAGLPGATGIGGASGAIVDGGNSNNANITIGTNDNFNLNFETGNATRVTITSSGNVGVGIINPTDRLEVSGTIKVPNIFPSIRTSINRFTVNEGGFGPPNETGMVTQFASGPYGRSIFAITHTGTNTGYFGLDAQIFTIGGEYNTDIRFVKGLQYGATNVLDSGTELMRIKGITGNVGIGTVDPNQRLTIAGNISATQLVYSGNYVPGILFLPNYTLPPTILNTLNYSVFVQTVSSDLIYNFDYGNFPQGCTVTMYLSGRHESIKRHAIVFSHPGLPGSSNTPVFIKGVGQSNNVYTFQNHVTKLTLTCLKPDDPSGVITGVAEIIRTDLNQSQGGLGFLRQEDNDRLLQENGDRLVIRNFT